MNTLNNYKIRVTHSVTVTVEAPDEETAVIEAGELANEEIMMGGDVVVGIEILEP